MTALLPIAAVESQPLRIDFGTSEARPFLNDGWGPDERQGGAGRPFIWGLGEVSELELFVNQPVDFTLAMEVEAFDFAGAPAQVIKVELNGQPAGELMAPSHLAWLTLPISAGQLHSGRNVLTFRYAYHQRPSDVVAGSPDTRPLAVQWFSLECRGLGGDGAVRVETTSSSSLILPQGSRVDFYLDLPPGRELWVPELVTRGGEEPLRLVIEIETSEGALESAAIAIGGQEAAKPASVRRELPSINPVRLRLSAVRDPGAPPPGVWERAVIRLRRWFGKEPRAEELALVSPQIRSVSSPVATGAEEDRQPAIAGKISRPNVLIYLIDTLRADHLGIYGYPRQTAPEIGRFAADAVVFENAQAQTSWTRTAVTSIFTGLNPQTHRVNGRRDALAQSLDTLAERLQAVGFQTEGIITNGNIEASFGLDQGFDGYRRLREVGSRVEVHKLSDQLNEWAFWWLDSERDAERPFFLYLHATDPHAPYTPREPFRSRFAAGVDPRLGELDQLRPILSGKQEAEPGMERQLIDLYDAEIAFNDHQFGRLLTKLRELDLYDSTLIILLSDHGEEFLDHGGWEHGQTLYREQLDIPLVIKLPQSDAAGRRITTVARQVDVLPTLLDYLELPLPNLLDGRSLLPAIAGREAPWMPIVSYAMVALDQREIESALARGWKLIENRSESTELAAEEFFDLRRDPTEEHDLVQQSDFAVSYLRQTLRTLDLAQSLRRVDSPEQVELGEELEERLRALGYLN